MNTSIQTLEGYEILDSRGRPTVMAICTLNSGAMGQASVPSGASSGSAEAHELRDDDPTRYGGLGCTKAVGHINNNIAKACKNREWEEQAELDSFLVELDGTPNKSRLGANAILAVSIAYARARAADMALPLYHFLANEALNARIMLPRPVINLFSGGLHAGGQVPVQDVLVYPHAAGSISEVLAQTYAVFQSAAKICEEKYQWRLLRADEGGQAPPFKSVEEMLDTAVEAIEAAGFKPGEEISLALDVAATHFASDDGYRILNESMTSEELVHRVVKWSDHYPIKSIEDGLAEEDWEHWPMLTHALRERACLSVGDDLLCTNPRRIQKARQHRACNALLLKVNQIGTLSEAREAFMQARTAGWKVMVSARSGETEDDWLADLAVGWGGDFIKVGSITQSERLAKYNRLLFLEKAYGLELFA